MSLNGQLGGKRMKRRAVRKRRKNSLHFEPLEDRRLLATFAVTNINDSGLGSLRQAILDANASANPDVDTRDEIVFNIADTGPHTIQPTSPLPDITDPVIIDGYSQGGTPNTDPSAFNGTLLIELNGAAAGEIANGLQITGGDSTVRGLIINGFRGEQIDDVFFGGNAIFLGELGGNVIEGNLLGTDADGDAALGNEYAAILIGGAFGSSPDNTIGGTTPAARNVISGNRFGIAIENTGSTGNLVAGNLIGTNAEGTAGLDITTFAAISINDASDNTIGGTTSAARNVISGNAIGVLIVSDDAPASGNLVLGNYVGTDVTGNNDVGNDVGVVMIAGGNLVGGTSVDARNVISGNNASGLVIAQFAAAAGTGNRVEGNFIGTDATGDAPLPNGGGDLAEIAARLNQIVLEVTGESPDITAELLAEVAGGVGLTEASGHTIGGSAAGAGNLISDNLGSGIALAESNDNEVVGNFIGTDSSGSGERGNQGAGVSLRQADNNLLQANTIAYNAEEGIFAENSSNNLIGGATAAARNVIFGNEEDGIGFWDGSNDNRVEGNFIGIDVTGTVAIGNGEDGVFVTDSTNNTIGGTTTATRNVISGNGEDGIGIANDSSDNRVLGNLIGTDVTGTVAIGNGDDGVSIDESANNTIGGTTAAFRNIISANGGDGIGIGPRATGNVVQGNYIGTNVAGTAPLGNGHANGGVGVGIADASGNTVGGTAPGAGNVIAANLGPGVGIAQTDSLTPTSNNFVLGNLIGLGSDGLTAMANESGVAIFEAAGNFIGSTEAGNIISGNDDFGVGIRGTGATNNVVEGNRIGTDADGLLARPNEDGGVAIRDAANNTVYDNLIAGNTGPGVLIGTIDPTAAATGNIVEANQIGVDVTGNSGLANLTGVAIGAASDNRVGSTDVTRGNLISGNDLAGVLILALDEFTATGNDVQGNVIGLDADETDALANGPGDAAAIAIIFNEGILELFGFDPGVTAEDIEAIRGGVVVWGASGNAIGGSAAGAGNVISGNLGSGVALVEAAQNVVQGNFVGTDETGTLERGNTGDGIFVSAGTGNLIGGTAAIARNVVAFNDFVGIAVEGSANGNALLGNSIFGNSGLGIDLDNDGVTGNDAGDPDTGANNLQNFPVLTAATRNGTTVVNGSLNSLANSSFRLEFFSSPSRDPSGFGEGQVFLGSLDRITSASGDVSFSFNSPVFVPSGFITATATLLDGSGDPVETSEFSNGVQVTGAPLELDFGDAPTAAQSSFTQSYPTTLADGGARHTIDVDGPYFSNEVDGGIDNKGFPDPEADGQPETDAEGDDNDGNDDESRRAFVLDEGSFVVGQTDGFIGFEWTSPVDAFINLWVDWNRDGDWADTGEQLFDDFIAEAGTGTSFNDLTIEVPDSAVPGITFARARISTQAGLSYAGPAPDGEVEDFFVEIVSAEGLAPIITNLNVQEMVEEDQAFQIDGTFTDDVGPHAVEVFWGDGTSSPATINQTNGSGTFVAQHTYADDDPSGTAEDTYTIEVRITDPQGSQDDEAQSVLVKNVAPVIRELRFEQDAIDENQVATLQVDLTDVGMLDTHVVQVHWGDGMSSPAAQTATNGIMTFTAQHQYLDDGNFTISIEATDDDTGQAPVETAIRVNNVAPTAMISGPSSVPTGGTGQFTFSASDPSPIDSAADFIYTVDWGDGSPIEQLTGSATGVMVTHAFSLSGAFAVMVTATDKDSGTGDTAAMQTVEVEIPQTQQLDFGDAPLATQSGFASDYPTLLPQGARHVIVADGPYLGHEPPDAEPDGQPDSHALGDDLSQSDDEDGLWWHHNQDNYHFTIAAGRYFKIPVKVHGEGYLAAFVDWNQDGDWNDSGEQIATDKHFAAGDHGKWIYLTGTAPHEAVPGETFLRLRVSSQPGLGPSGEAVDGEVEDHTAKIVASAKAHKPRFAKFGKQKFLQHGLFAKFKKLNFLGRDVDLAKDHEGFSKDPPFVGDKFHTKHLRDQIADKHPHVQQIKLEKKFDQIFGEHFKEPDKSVHGHQKLVKSNHYIATAPLRSKKIRHDPGEHVTNHSPQPVSHYEDLDGKNADKFYAALGHCKFNQAHKSRSKLWSMQYAQAGWTKTSSFKGSYLKNNWQRALDDQAVAAHVFRTENNWHAIG